MGFNTEEVAKVIEKIGEAIEENKEFLTELDAAIGDADHGINMNKGFKAVREKIKAVKVKDAGELFKLVGMTLVSTVGGASGPLYGTAFMKAASCVQGKQEIDMRDFCSMLEAAVEGIKLRGKAVQGDKTMLDALEPALFQVKNGLDNGFSSVNILENAKNAALDGVNYTKNIAAKRGRASYLGERSIGHQDPGATSSYLILNCIYEKVKEVCDK